MVKLLKYTYEDSGFDSFMQRSLSSDPAARTLSDVSAMHPQMNINYDQQQVSGNMGDVFTIARILLDGINGRIDIRDQQKINTLIRLGELDD